MVHVPRVRYELVREQDRVSMRVERSVLVFVVVIFYRLTLILKTAMFDLT